MNQTASDDWPEGGSSVRPVDATRERLLEAAGRLFTERGYAGTSLRAVTAEAGVSVSAANYHFGSKQALLHAVCERHIGWLNEERIDALDALEARFAPDIPPLEEILRAFFRPVLRARGLEPRRDPREVAARLYADPPEISRELREKLFGPLSRRMREALAASFPGADPGQLGLAFEFAVGAMVHTAVSHLAMLDPDADRGVHNEELVEQLTVYCAAGIRAQVAAGPREEQ